ncbi:MAG: 50S ribosomal protein L18 [Candidatus Thermoplasmatota archaeon]
MKAGPRYHVKPRRHRQGRTDYRKRLKLLKSKKPRIVARRSLQYIRVQVIAFDQSGDKVLASAFSKELTTKYAWKYSSAATPAAYLTGLLAGVRAKQHGITEGILDIGRNKPTKGNTLFAALKGVVDAGIVCPHDPEMLPSEERILGKHLNADIAAAVEAVKTKILQGGKE